MTGIVAVGVFQGLMPCWPSCERGMPLAARMQLSRWLLAAGMSPPFFFPSLTCRPLLTTAAFSPVRLGARGSCCVGNPQQALVKCSPF